MPNRYQMIRRQYRPIALILYVSFYLAIGALPPADGLAQTNGMALLEQGKCSEATGFFALALQKTPNDPDVNFKMGRSLLAGGKPSEAISYLEKAARLEPKKADYRFWLGVGYWAVMDFENEKSSYLQALKLEPDHLSANLYLGHNYLDQNKLDQALGQYERVLDIDPDFPEALYNRAVVFEKLRRTNDAIRGWKNYLDHYPTGKWAIQAVEQLRGHGDFSYRGFWLGRNKVANPVDFFDAGSSRVRNTCKKNIDAVAAVLQSDPSLTLHIIAYVAGDAVMAEARAKALKKRIVESNPAVTSSRVKVSWFDVPENLFSGNKKYVLEESVNFFTQTNNSN